MCISRQDKIDIATTLGGAMHFFILGAIEIRKQDHVVRLSGTMQQTLLAALLVSGGTLLTVDTLMEELWGTTPPSKVGNALHAQISRLRRNLAGLEPERTESRLCTSASGYLLSVDRSELDAWTFVDTVEKIRSRMEAGLVGSMLAYVADIRAALARWRGPVFGGLTGGPLCQTAAAKYSESRIAALSLLYELEIKSGRSVKILPELTELFAQNPSQEQLCMLLMLALYRSGRQIDALSVYRKFRRRLAEGLGIEPTPALQEYERAILAHDPILMTDFPISAQPVVMAAGGHEPGPRYGRLAGSGTALG
jgi:DNA-binding SARP family transcriptional activator